MELIKRQVKGSRLTIEEMDSNLEYLNQLNIVDIYQEDSNLIFEKTNESISIEVGLKPEDKKSYINNLSLNTKKYYKGVLYNELSKIPLYYNVDENNQLPIMIDYTKKYILNANLGYWIDNIYNTTNFKSSLQEVSNYSTLMDIGTGFNNTVNTITIQSDGKILVGGSFTSYNGVSSNRIIRLNSDGSQDSSFVIGTGFNSTVDTITIQDDGKILVGGIFTTYNGVSSNNIIRLNSDGSQDSSFVIGTGFSNFVRSIVIQSDGKILVGGLFTSYKGVTSNYIIRLNTDGSIDSSFVIGTGINSAVNTISIQSDGKILVGGQFTSSNRIIRLNSDGSQDSSFVIGTGFNSSVYSIVIQSDGKILVGGLFASYNGVSSNRIIRLNTDGSQDSSFVIGTGFNSSVNTISIQSDGKILVGGLFASYNGVSSNRIIRLNSDGSQDTSFNIGTIGTVNTIYIQSDGKILVGGAFTSYNVVVSSNRIIRLNSDGSSNTTTYRLIKRTFYNIKSDINLIANLIVENDELKIELNGIVQKSTLDYTLIEY